MDTPRCSVGTLRRSAASYIVWPSMRMLPPLGCSSPAMARKVVVLPQPEGPSRVTMLAAADVEADAVHRDGVAVADDEVADLDPVTLSLTSAPSSCRASAGTGSPAPRSP